jgi:hypothetical protein
MPVELKGRPMFTHISYDDFRVLRTNLLQGGRAGRIILEEYSHSTASALSDKYR